MGNNESSFFFKNSLENLPQQVRKYFLLRFILEAIKNTKVEEFFTLKNLLKKEEKKSPLKIDSEEEYHLSVMHTPKKKFRPLPILPKPTLPPRNIIAKTQRIISPPIPQMHTAWQTQALNPQIQLAPKRPIMPSSPRIPNYPLPPNLQYLKPQPTYEPLDLGRLNQILQDPAVRSIECNGPEEKIVVKTATGAKPSGIALGKEEINQVLQAFSTTSKIPLHEGIYKIAASNLILSAIVSDIVGSKFIITKMSSPPIAPMQRWY